MSGPRKLSDIFNMTNPVMRKRSQSTQSRLRQTLDVDSMKTRFSRNKNLVDPKSFHLLVDYDQLKRYKVFGIYKPPFAPMRRRDASENVHGVSVESFVDVALRSRDLEPLVEVLMNDNSDRSKGEGLHIRVLHDLATETGGPVAIHVSSPSLYTGTDQATYIYEAMLHGHVVIRPPGNTSSSSASSGVPVLYENLDEIFPHHSQRVRGLDDANNRTVSVPSRRAGGPPEQLPCPMVTAAPTLQLSVQRYGFYAMHPITLVTLVLTNPMTSVAPHFGPLLYKATGSYIVGDPMGLRDAYNPQVVTGHQGDTHNPILTETYSRNTNPYISKLIGDKDFPRVFLNLRKVRYNFWERDPQYRAGSNAPWLPYSKPIELVCDGSLLPLVGEAQHNIKQQRISIMDGVWSPTLRSVGV